MPAGALEQKAAVMKSAGGWGWSARRDVSCHRGHVKATTRVKAQVCRGHRVFLEFHFIKRALSQAHDITADMLVFKEGNMFAPSPPHLIARTRVRRCLSRYDRYPTNESVCR